MMAAFAINNLADANHVCAERRGAAVEIKFPSPAESFAVLIFELIPSVGEVVRPGEKGSIVVWTEILPVFHAQGGFSRTG